MQNERKLIFASSNRHKLNEIKSILPAGIQLIGLHDIGWTADIPEPYNTFEENAATKAMTIFQHTRLTCFAEDSGLIIEALDGRPGVLSARYAGGHGDSKANIEKVLDDMKDVVNRQARFVAVIAYKAQEMEMQYFSGMVKGSIALSSTGTRGFGYDPIFIPAGFSQSFGVLPDTIKKTISHRTKAFTLFNDFLSSRNKL